MHLIDSIWTSVTYVTSFLQVPLLLTSFGAFRHGNNGGPVFWPPSGAPSGPGSDFTCDYSKMVGFSKCSTPDNRGCWLKNNKTGVEYNINTNYQESDDTPIGITRHYVLNITDDWINADGLNFTEAKVFNGTYPGPWIQACWGDTVTVIVNNHLKSNGTSIHWHGIRQWLTMHMDGVNGITQCPIAPGDSFTYTWRVMQYGSSWYHSHYSVQYADGAVGPITLHGPSSAPYDEAILPILMTDWAHNSAFEALFTSPQNPSILLNGAGNITQYNNNVAAELTIPSRYTIKLDPPESRPRPKRYLLRLINTSWDTTFVFSIDNHWIQIVGADFVPIHPYMNTSVLISIGQRYHVIVTAKPEPLPNGNPLPEDGNYWIRTWVADCFGQAQGSPGYEKTGILRYGSSQALPTTQEWPDISLHCSDEAYKNLVPIVPWDVGPAANKLANEIGQSFPVQVNVDPSIYPLAVYSMAGDDFTPLQVDYSDPIFLKLNYTGKWPPLWAVYPENYTSQDWVYMVIKGTNGDTFGAHPLHLHGHDFAILQQIENATYPDQLNLKLDNPPRRDVVLLPDNGYIVIAFQTDNPGAWLVHCHIADHIAIGLGFQILERQQSAAEIWPSLSESPALQIAQNGCNNWNKWWGNCNNWWPSDGSSCLKGYDEFSPDSGV